MRRKRKVCSVCQTQKPHSEYAANGHGGLRGECRECQRKIARNGVTITGLRGGVRYTTELEQAAQALARREADLPAGPCTCGCEHDGHGVNGCSICGKCPKYFEAGR